jgi:hypothetical protein
MRNGGSSGGVARCLAGCLFSTTLWRRRKSSTFSHPCHCQKLLEEEVELPDDSRIVSVMPISNYSLFKTSLQVLRSNMEILQKSASLTDCAYQIVRLRFCKEIDNYASRNNLQAATEPNLDVLATCRMFRTKLFRASVGRSF